MVNELAIKDQPSSMECLKKPELEEKNLKKTMRNQSYNFYVNNNILKTLCSLLVVCCNIVVVYISYIVVLEPKVF